MSIAKSETKTLRGHLYNFHGFRDTAGLKHEELVSIHESFHLDDWMTRPHSHPQGSVQHDNIDLGDFEDVSAYFDKVIRIAKGDFE